MQDVTTVKLFDQDVREVYALRKVLWAEPRSALTALVNGVWEIRAARNPLRHLSLSVRKSLKKYFFPPGVVRSEVDENESVKALRRRVEEFLRCTVCREPVQDARDAQPADGKIAHCRCVKS